MRKTRSETQSSRNTRDKDAAVERNDPGVNDDVEVNDGADDGESEYWADDYYPCPICSRMVSPGRDEVCKHYQAATWDGE